MSTNGSLLRGAPFVNGKASPLDRLRDDQGRDLWAVAAERYDPKNKRWTPYGVTFVHAYDVLGAHREFRRSHPGEIVRIVAAGHPVGFFSQDGKVLKG